MSVNLQVQVAETTAETILLGAKEHGLKTGTDHFIADGHRHYKVNAKGQISGDFDYIDKLGKVSLKAKDRNSRSKEVNERLLQAGNIAHARDEWSKNGFKVEAKPLEGLLTARRGETVIKVTAAFDGSMKIDADGFKENACSTEIGKVLKKIGQYKTLSNTPKNERQHVIRTTTGG